MEEALPLLLLRLRPRAGQLVWHMCADRAVSTAVACLGMLCEDRGDGDQGGSGRIAGSADEDDRGRTSSERALGGALVGAAR